LQDVKVQEVSLDGKHLVIACTIYVNEKPIQTYALIDCGATGIAFIDESFASHHQVPFEKLLIPRSLEVIDGRPIESGDITHLARAKMEIEGHREDLPMFVTKLGHYPIVLGIPWLRLHDVAISFASNTVRFGSSYCLSHCLSQPTEVQGIKEDLPSRPNVNISMIGAAPLLTLHKKKKLEVFSLSLYEINQALKASGEKVDPRKVVPEHFHEFLHLFDKVKADQLPPHRPYDHTIPLVEGTTPPYGPLYSMSRNELVAMKEFIEENLPKGFIRSSSSPAGAPCLFVKKSDGSLRLCNDYRGLNEITIKNRYPLPLIQETLMRLQKAKWYTKLDLRGAYNLLRIAEGEEWKTAFRTRYGHFEYTVMPFGLTNAPASFQHFINDTLREFLDDFVNAYIDDILIYSETYEDNVRHTRKVLEALSNAGLHLKPEKCEFHVQTVKYLGVILTPKGVQMDPAKVEAVKDWPVPQHLKDVQAFLGFANYYRRFIFAYSKKVAPMTALTRKDTPFVWSPDCQKAFEELKEAFTSAPILRHFDPDRPIVVETDASDFVSGGVLSQPDEEGVLHPVAYFSKKHSPAECNYEIYDKELLAIVRAFEEWRPHLESAPESIKVLTDHKNLEYFMTTKLLNRRQARWSEFLSRFDFVIVYRPGKQGGKPDALTRRSGDLPKEGDERLRHQSQVILKPKNLQLLADNELDEQVPELEQLLRNGYESDPFPAEVMEMLDNGVRQDKRITLAECERIEGRLHYRKRLYVPDSDELRLHLVKAHHDPPAAGHQGRSKTFELLSRLYYWPKMRQSVEQYVRNCDTCRRSKTPRHAPFGVLRPLGIPERPWQEITMDFVTGLPDCDGYDAILVVVDRLTKMRHFTACRTDCSAEDLADIFLRDIFRLHGLPEVMVSDCGPQFASRFWERVCSCLHVDRRLSTAFHPQTDGQTEIFNASMEQYLRAYVSYQQDDWVSLLPMAEFAANNSASETTRMSPFFACYGFDPKMTITVGQATPNPETVNANQKMETMQKIHEHLRAEMRFSQDRQEEGANNRRIPAPRFEVGDEVWLLSRNMRTERPARKLDWKRLGRFKILAKVGSYAYKLDLPRTMKVHPVFHVSLLEPAANDPMPGQQREPPPPVVVDGEDEYHVEEILDSKMVRRRLRYLVKWTGYDQPDWEPAENVNGLAAVDEFHEKYPGKPGPLPEDGD
jgi:hypothetical protein